MSSTARSYQSVPLAAPRSEILEATVVDDAGETKTVLALINERVSATSTSMHLVVEVVPVSLTWTAAGETYTQRLDGVHDTTFDVQLNQDAAGGWKARFATIVDPILAQEIRGFGIASHAWSRLIDFGQKHAPRADVASLSLSLVDATDDEDRDRRNRFYERLGFTLIFATDTENRTGRCVASSMSQLTTNNPPGVTITSTAAAIAKLRQELTLSQRETRRAREERGRVESAQSSEASRWRRRFYTAAGIAVAASGIAFIW